MISTTYKLKSSRLFDNFSGVAFLSFRRNLYLLHFALFRRKHRAKRFLLNDKNTLTAKIVKEPSSKDQTKFGFISSGPKGIFKKVVMFDRLSNGKWNLAFGDLTDGDVDDVVITNNNDITKVLGTVAMATYIFSEKYPNRSIIIRPVDDKRKRLYNIIFNRHIEAISLIFNVFGKIKNRRQPFLKEKNYDSFELVRK